MNASTSLSSRWNCWKATRSLRSWLFCRNHSLCRRFSKLPLRFVMASRLRTRRASSIAISSPRTYFLRTMERSRSSTSAWLNCPANHPTLTVAGTPVGTASYMSPEQISGEHLDARTDLFSFGIVLYEMATGRRAFEGPTAAIVHEAILQRTPTSAHELASHVPRSLEAVISRALEKDRMHRYQSVSEIRKDLMQIQREIHPRRRFLRYSFAAAMLLLLVGWGAWRYWQVRNSVTLSPSDTIVLTDIDNQTGDAALGQGMSTALQVALMQTPYLNLLGPDKLHETLHALNLPNDTKVTVSPELARQVCEYTHSRGIVSGSIMNLGNRYGIELQVINCATGAKFDAIPITQIHD